MNQSLLVGVDVSKLTFDAAFADRKPQIYDNNLDGYESFLKCLLPGSHVVMEATGNYFLKLATYLHDHGVMVSVINPAVIAYYARMKLSRAKTDAVDAEIIRRFACHEELAPWVPPGELFNELNQLDSHLNGLLGDRTRVVNRIEALTQCASINTFTLADLEDQLADLDLRIKRCEKELVQVAESCCAEELALLTSIKGIGKKTAVMLIVLTQGFTRFASYKQFAAYVGISSFVKRSGTSVRGAGGITKMGNPRMRQLLYMGALTAWKNNRACQVFASRLADNGKPYKVIRIAIANKLIRQAFAVCQKREMYSEQYI